MKKYNVLITGGTRGLGKEIAEFLINEGCSVAVIARSDENNIDYGYRKKLKAYIKADLSDDEQVNEVIANPQLAEIDILINNAAHRIFKPFDKFTDQEIINYISLNINSSIKLSKSVLSGMRKRGYGRIINISSRAGYSGYSTGSLYCATKGFMIRFTEAIAKDLTKEKNNITANLVCPSGLVTLEGKKSSDYDKKIRLINNYLKRIIGTDINGICFNTFSLKEKAYFVVKNILQLSGVKV